MPSSQTPPEFFIDRSLGRKLLPDALRAAGYTVHTMWSVYGPDAEQRISDVQWLTEGAAGARIFLLTNPQLVGAEQNTIFLDNIHRIIKLSRKPGPYVYGSIAIGSSHCGRDRRTVQAVRL